MNISLAAFTAALLIGACPMAMAVSHVDLSVRGTITPSACTPTLSNGGLVDYGKISVQDLHPTSVTELPPTTFKLAVNCEGLTLFGLASRDNQTTLPGPATTYLLGWLSDRQWVGVYYLKLENVQSDHPTAHTIVSTDNGGSWRYLSPGSSWAANTLLALGKSDLGPALIKDASMDLVVEPVIYPKNQLPVGESVPLDGSATFELRYL